jgi:hypothetical protein
MLGLGAAAEAEVREALGPGFPKHPSTRSSPSGPWWRAANLIGGLLPWGFLTQANARKLI